MTGEINLKGQVTQIGGLREKLNGAKKAGVKHVLIPRDNMKDLQKIKSSGNSPLDNTFKITPVDNIWDVLRHCFNKSVDVVRY